MNVHHPGPGATNKQLAIYHKKRADALSDYVSSLEISSFPSDKDFWRRGLQDEINESLRYNQLAIFDQIETLMTGKRPPTTDEFLKNPENIPTEYLKMEADFYDNIGEHGVASNFRIEMEKRKKLE